MSALMRVCLLGEGVGRPITAQLCEDLSQPLSRPVPACFPTQLVRRFTPLLLAVLDAGAARNPGLEAMKGVRAKQTTSQFLGVYTKG